MWASSASARSLPAFAPPTIRKSLVGRLIVVVANLEPRKMRFGTSEGHDAGGGPGRQGYFRAVSRCRRGARHAGQVMDIRVRALKWSASTPCCRRRSAPAAAIRVAGLMRTRSSSGEAQINQCPPGGSATIRALAELLGRDDQPLNPANGVESPPRVAWIDEARCIGCARCLPPCPVDAIVGAAKYLHTVIVDRCTGCELCLRPARSIASRCAPGPRRQLNQAALNRERYRGAHAQRLQQRAKERQRELDAKKAAAPRRVPAARESAP